ncbi:F510_1955 family glycosylhydrolase [Thalassobacillus hwangdonensis]|uniref:F510_1955 family glycosylhydrolase n=1 Tax=Thalassobacillus hwangdonensis TaxID=546108 RepID=A0ABW3L5M0_9BACI
MKKTVLISSLALGVFLAGCNDSSDETETDTQAPAQEESQDQTKQEDKSSTTASESSISNDDFYQAFDGAVEHVHGIGYDKTNNLMVASHSGLKLYDGQSWYSTKEMNNDYMGFNAVNEGFYTSGHPGPESDLPNPIGLQKSSDGGKSLEALAFEGETDFHLMGVGYESHAIYVYNQHENSEIGTGLYKSFDDGQSWEQAKAEGLGKELYTIAVHPQNKEVVAAAAKSGVYLSTDGGNTFELISAEDRQGTAVHFTDTHLYFATYYQNPELVQYDLENESKETVELPEMKQDGVMYMAQNPNDSEAFTILTFNGKAFVNKGKGTEWKSIIENGKTVNE